MTNEFILRRGSDLLLQSNEVSGDWNNKSLIGKLYNGIL